MSSRALYEDYFPFILAEMAPQIGKDFQGRTSLSILLDPSRQILPGHLVTGKLFVLRRIKWQRTVTNEATEIYLKLFQHSFTGTSFNLCIKIQISDEEYFHEMEQQECSRMFLCIKWLINDYG